jgi:molecular chaperone DnaK
VRESLEAEDPTAINAKTEALQTAFHAISEAMYQRAQESAATAGNGNGSGPSGDSESSDDEDVVDAEVVDEPKA